MAKTLPRLIDCKVGSADVTLTLKSSRLVDVLITGSEEEKHSIGDPTFVLAPSELSSGHENDQLEAILFDEGSSSSRTQQLDLSEPQDWSDESAFQEIEAEDECTPIEVLAHATKRGNNSLSTHQGLDLSTSSGDWEHSHFSTSSMENTSFEDGEDDDESYAFSVIENHSILLMETTSDEPSTIINETSAAAQNKRSQEELVSSLPTGPASLKQHRNNCQMVAIRNFVSEEKSIINHPTKTRHSVALFSMEESVETIPVCIEQFLVGQDHPSDNEALQQTGALVKAHTTCCDETISKDKNPPTESHKEDLSHRDDNHQTTGEEPSPGIITASQSQTSSLSKSTGGSLLKTINLPKLPLRTATFSPQEDDDLPIVTVEPRKKRSSRARKKKTTTKASEGSITVVDPVKRRRRGTRPSYHKYVNRQIQRQVEEWNEAITASAAQGEEPTPKHCNDRTTRKTSKKITSFAASNYMIGDRESLTEEIEGNRDRAGTFSPLGGIRQRALSDHEAVKQTLPAPMSPKSSRRWWKRFHKRGFQDRSEPDRGEKGDTTEEENVQGIGQEVDEEKNAERSSEGFPTRKKVESAGVETQLQSLFSGALCCAFNSVP